MPDVEVAPAPAAETVTDAKAVAPGARKRRLPLLAWIGIAVGGQVLVCYLVLLLAVSPRLNAVAKAGAEPGATAPHPAAPAKESPRNILSLDPMVMNLVAVEGEKSAFAKIGLAIELSGEKPPVGLDAKLPRLRDAVITAVSGKSVGDVARPEGKEALRRELEKAMSEVLGPEVSVLNVYFTNFVIQ